MNLKIIDKDGNIKYLNPVKTTNVVVSQTKGNSTVEVMSQKAITDELELLEKIINEIDIREQLKNYYTKTEIDEMWDSFDKIDCGTY